MNIAVCFGGRWMVGAGAMARCCGIFGRHSRVPRGGPRCPPHAGRDAGWMLVTPLRQPHAASQHATLIGQRVMRFSFPATRRFAGAGFIRRRRYAAAAYPDLPGLERFVDARSQRT